VPDRREFLGTGVGFPVRLAPDGGVIASAGEQAVAESIWVILSTAPGERVMRPRFGCEIHRLVFAGDDSGTRALVAHHVTEALTTWEPRIDVLDVRVEGGGDLRTALLISVDYRLRANNAVHNMVYPFYATEGLRT
jgi:phage baseplate assembly protein W